MTSTPSLNLPIHSTITDNGGGVPMRPSASRSMSASSVNQLGPGYDRNDQSFNSVITELPSTPIAERNAVPLPPAGTPMPSTPHARSGAVTPLPNPAAGIGTVPGSGVSTLHAGTSQKAFNIHTSLLTQRSPYFRDLFDERPDLASDPKPHVPELTFEDLDEFAFALFNRWLYGASLNGPSDFHSMQHYLCLYVLAERFRIERLKNEVLDVVRAYYRAANMTAPAARLEYIYNASEGPNPMRKFLVTTAAYRILCEREGRVSNVMRQVIAKGGELAIDFCEALVTLHRNELKDVRRSPNCDFHEHSETKKCAKFSLEPYQSQ